MAESSNRQLPRAWRLVALALILILAAGLRFYKLNAQSFWNDEGNSARIAERSVRLIVEGAGGDIHPPGYYLLLAGWRALAGYTEFALRTFSVLVSVISVALVYTVGGRLFDRRVGWAAALLVAINPFQVYYGQEARMYALFATLSTASILLAERVLTMPARMQSGRFNRRSDGAIIAGYVLVNVAGLYTHYAFPFVLFAETLVFLVWVLRREKKLHGFVVWGLLQGVTILLFAPWIPAGWRQVTTWPTSVTASNVDIARFATRLAYGSTLPLEVARFGLIPLGILPVVGLFPPLDPQSEQRRHYLSFNERIGLIGAWFFLPVLLMVSFGIMREPSLKFLLPSGVALWILAGRGVVMGWRLGSPQPGVESTSSLVTRGIIVLLLAAGLYPAWVSLNNMYFNPAYARDNYRAIAERIRAEAGESAAVVLDAPNQWEVFTYYYPDGPNITPLPNDNTADTLDRLLRDNHRIYALFWGEIEQDPERVVERVLDARAFDTGSEWYGAVRLVTYAVPNETATEATTESGARFGEHVTLLGYALSAEALAPGDALGVKLFWQTDAPLGERYKVFVHLYGPDGALIAQHDSEPGGDLAPTNTWQPGVQVMDNHGVLLPVEALPGTYRLVIGLYDLMTGDRLPITMDGAPIGDNLAIREIMVR